MKRLISLILAAVTLVLIIPTVHISAQTETTSRNVIPLDDGGYLAIELTAESSLSRATASKSKICTRYNDNDEVLWKATLTGNFTYDGITASCTSCSCSVAIYSNDWYTDSKTSWKNANSAYATVVMGRKVLGVTVARETFDLTLTCDRYGNVR